jgi:(2R)-3-sulfolactate dehydrogenase (NADP+)
MAFAAPCNGEAPLLIDQASSARAFVNIRDLAMAKRPIPQGWAVDENGNDTTDAAAALKGALLPFGGAKGGNIAMMVEILATASGGLWSVDAPSYLEGDKNSAVGMFVLAIQPAFLNERFSERLSEHLQHLQENYGVYVPGSARRKARKAAQLHGLHLDESVVEQVAQFITPY